MGLCSEPPTHPQVCYAGRCQNLLVYGKKNCSAKCNSHGVGCASVLPVAAASRALHLQAAWVVVPAVHFASLP